MDSREALNSLETIRTILERSTNYTHIAPAGIIAAGLAAGAAAGCGAWWELGPGRPIGFFALWGLTLVVAIAAGVGTTVRRARLLGETFWCRKLQFAVVRATPGALLAALLTVAFFDAGRADLCPGAWMACYGVAILSAGVVLDWEFRAVAWAFLIAGSAAFFLLRESPNLSLGIAFGGLHVLLGLSRIVMEGIDACRSPAPLRGTRI